MSVTIRFADRAAKSKQPIIRVIDFLQKEDPEFLAFGEGNPSIEACPIDTIREISERLLAEEPKYMFSYTATLGDPQFRELIKKRMVEKKGMDPENNEILVMTGGQQGLMVVPQMFTNEGDAVITEEITYQGMLDTIRNFGGHTVGVRQEEDGIDVAALEEALKTTERVSYIYLIPNFSNPTGITTSLEKRKAVYELACRYDKIIVEDDPYGDLRYEGEDIPTLKSMDTENRVVYLGTFSKTIAAGLRVGFMAARPEIIAKAANCKGLSDSNTPCFNQLICRDFLRDHDFEGNIRNICRISGEKWRAARKGLEEGLPEGWKVYDAKGGLFLYVVAPPYVDEEQFQQLCYQHKVGFSPSSSFAADEKPHGGFRMAFTPHTVPEIEEGCRRFCQAAKEYGEMNR